MVYTIHPIANTIDAKPVQSKIITVINNNANEIVYKTSKQMTKANENNFI